MGSHENVLKTPTSCNLRDQVHTNAAVKLKEKFMQGDIRKLLLSNREFGFNDLICQQRRKLLIG